MRKLYAPRSKIRTWLRKKSIPDAIKDALNDKKFKNKPKKVVVKIEL